MCGQHVLKQEEQKRDGISSVGTAWYASREGAERSGRKCWGHGSHATGLRTSMDTS